jgi:aldehyde:ferredoxin oxidoreductase
VISDTEFDDFVKDTLRREHQFNSDAGITALDYRFTESFYEETQIFDMAIYHSLPKFR